MKDVNVSDDLRQLSLS
jgi:hypothetical protein